MRGKNIYKLGVNLRLKNDEIDMLLGKTNIETNQSSLSLGPFIYPGTHYGTISIKDF